MNNGYISLGYAQPFSTSHVIALHTSRARLHWKIVGGRLLEGLTLYFVEKISKRARSVGGDCESCRALLSFIY